MSALIVSKKIVLTVWREGLVPSGGGGSRSTRQALRAIAPAVSNEAPGEVILPPAGVAWVPTRGGSPGLVIGITEALRASVRWAEATPQTIDCLVEVNGRVGWSVIAAVMCTEQAEPSSFAAWPRAWE